MLRVLVLLFSFLTLCVEAVQPNEISLDGKLVTSLKNAMASAVDGSVIELGAGIYKDGGVLKANFVTIKGVKGTHLKGFSTKGKGALVIRGNDTEIINIECSNVSVRDGNGACVRLEGRNLQLRDVYFHDSQQGLLSGKSSGNILIENSRFERLGHGGRSHGIYVGSGELYINNSKFLSSKKEGHEIKSRARKTLISNSTIASINGKDSRLIDVSNGGELEVKNCVLQQGNKTSNWNLIGYGLEGLKYKNNTISIKNNLFILDRKNGNKVLHTKGKIKSIAVEKNVLIGKISDNKFDDSNLFYKDRSDAGVEPFPSLPERNR